MLLYLIVGEFSMMDIAFPPIFSGVPVRADASWRENMQVIPDSMNSLNVLFILIGFESYCLYSLMQWMVTEAEDKPGEETFRTAFPSCRVFLTTAMARPFQLFRSQTL